MTNFEMLVKEGCDYNRHGDGLGCFLFRLRSGVDACNGECEDCQVESWKWLKQEYKPVLLSSDKGLKAGDYLMVRDTNKGSWEKRLFCFFFKNKFYCVPTSSSDLDVFNCVGYKEARIPMMFE